MCFVNKRLASAWQAYSADNCLASCLYNDGVEGGSSGNFRLSHLYWWVSRIILLHVVSQLWIEAVNNTFWRVCLHCSPAQCYLYRPTCVVYLCDFSAYELCDDDNDDNDSLLSSHTLSAYSSIHLKQCQTELSSSRIWQMLPFLPVCFRDRWSLPSSLLY